MTPIRMPSATEQGDTRIGIVGPSRGKNILMVEIEGEVKRMLIMAEV